jgi:hypothetical protein
MGFWDGCLIGVAVLAALAAPYGVFRLCLWLSERASLYQKQEKSGASVASCFVALQEVIEPPATHVFQVKEQGRAHSEEEATGEGELPQGGGAKQSFADGRSQTNLGNEGKAESGIGQ